ncbi:uncharacterized protein (DUF58 family) [Diaminobutyricimonas aerilata]|uniref:Uncharacterized protein (DUF58 family) n=1 Tax=Diaminobutyricimonas aerilata TaxID=1162967 RepID=A0A2M9CII8_9MICO|nr:DUF58 domain-containing protein [Diaminobutyricimonas aerilata]PJJ71707.1 uncharacterized protein (DUF58 family) [Diaminobutyricimonas aerilata]
MARELEARRRRLSARGWATLVLAAVLFVAAYSLGYEELLLPAGVALLLVVSGVVTALVRSPWLEVKRTFTPASVGAGDTVRVTVTVSNVGASPTVAAQWTDTAPWGGSPSGTLPGLAWGARRDARVEYELRAHRRGIVSFGPLLLDLRDPFGMVDVEHHIGGVDRLVVTPQVSRLPADGSAFGEGEGSAQFVQRRTTGNDDDLMTREYRTGDALRRVHWRASARHGELMVRQEEQRSFPDARLILDTRRASYPDAVGGESDGFEWAVRMAASMGVHLGDAGYRLTVLETAPAQLVQPGATSERAERDGIYLESLAGVRLIDAAPDAAAVERETPATGGPLFAVFADPESDVLRWASGLRRPGDRAVVFLLPGARPATVDALGRAGWTLVSVRPDDDPSVGWADAVRAIEPADLRG